MDTQGIIHEHSKIKLELYRLYLERYLSVLLVTSHFEKLVITDLFAGAGFSDNEEKGSAVIAAETIKKIDKEQNRNKKQILLFLNETNKKYSTKLKEIFTGQKFITITETDANDYAKNWQPLPNSHNLFFLDPHGYTQISTENLKRLFSVQISDFLIFIPLSFIYRFLKPIAEKQINSGNLFGEDEKNKDQKNAEEKLAPVAKFLSGLELDKSAVEQTSDIEDFSKKIVDALKKIGKTDFVFSQMIKNKGNSNKYCLFFVTHNILGADKFLESQKNCCKEKTIKRNSKHLSASI